ncbi:MAG: spheroidene monooxygenase [Actinomycetota bacterium]|nr:spheroidene monooxygenase [Actinomycetota bacterium]
MIASVHLADLSVRRALAVLRRAPDPASTPGLRYSKVALAAPLRSSILPAPDLKRPGLIAFWDDDDALSRFLAEDRASTPFAQGWHVRLVPLRAFGSWPGVPSDLPGTRAVDYDGPTVVLTLGRLRITQALRFLRTSAKAEAAVLSAPGLIWATGLGRPPLVATCSLWRSAHAASTYAYGPNDAAHQTAIRSDRARPFHHESAFIRFRPYGSEGRLDGKNRLPENSLAGV